MTAPIRRTAAALTIALVAGCGGTEEPLDPRRALAVACVGFQEAMQAGDKDRMLALAGPGARGDLEATPAATIAEAGRYLPETFSIADVRLADDPSRGVMTMSAAGNVRYGRCEAVQIDGEWRVAQFDWSALDPANRLAAGDPPERVVEKLHRTVLEVFDPGAASAFFTLDAKGAFAAAPEDMAERIGALHRGALPRGYTVADSTVDDTQARLALSGDGSAGADAPLTGEAVLRRENGEWRVAAWTWGDTALP